MLIYKRQQDFVTPGGSSKGRPTKSNERRLQHGNEYRTKYEAWKSPKRIIIFSSAEVGLPRGTPKSTPEAVMTRPERVEFDYGAQTPGQGSIRSLGGVGPSTVLGCKAIL
ncbi:uncharacterized protein SPSK_03752 [Sporothrix schenckii 1099-18]|uniref:Uncharacterized protein n=1 Tax=Sporothrix schenckii 1099-18 TaxID=1397361 RepID=A0A0F2M0V0_SPOSC|nr:uncharacterized protein SPSK_03752 [Sporothrix schenckii 1099-18]KJR82380.1 hypothetical protein SPSK_03752 [Sporothrix schenckii 1099-18]